MSTQSRHPQAGQPSDPDPQAIALQPIDLLLRQGTPEELTAMRSRVAADPLLALEVADTVTLLGRLREACTTSSPEFAGELFDLVRQAERRLGRRARPPILAWMATAAAAAALFATLALCDPLGLRSGAPDRAEIAQAPGSDRRELSPLPPTPDEIAKQEAVELMRQRFSLENAECLQQALDTALAAPHDPLSAWLQPANTMAVLRLDHELRGQASVRAKALRSEGAMPAADERVQRLADDLAAELPALLADPEAQIDDVARGLRAMVAAGDGGAVRRSAIAAACRWLERLLPSTAGADRVLALTALIDGEAAGYACPSIATVGKHFVDEIVLADEDIWRRRRPELLSPFAHPGTLGEAGRLLDLLPAFDVEADSCRLARQLLLGALQERRGADQDQPDVLAAIVYGFGDLLGPGEVDSLVRQLTRWKPARLAPDFDTVQQIAWGVEPGLVGFTRLQRELRQLVILPAPTGFAARAGFCLCLASSFAAGRLHALERFELGE